MHDGVWHPLVEDSIPYSDGDEPERYLKQTFENAADLSSDSEELALAVKDWPSQYHLSSLRSNLLRSLDIRKTARVLELGCGCGALTRYLGETAGRVVAVEGSPVRARLARLRCRDLDNVDIVAGNFDDMALEGPFDIVTLIGVIEYAAMYWRRAGNPFEGMLRFALENLSPGRGAGRRHREQAGHEVLLGVHRGSPVETVPRHRGIPRPGRPPNVRQAGTRRPGDAVRLHGFRAAAPLPGLQAPVRPHQRPVPFGEGMRRVQPGRLVPGTFPGLHLRAGAPLQRSAGALVRGDRPA